VRAIVQNAFGGLEVLNLEDRPMPTPGHGQVLVEVGAFGVCRRDAIVRAGVLHQGVKLPLIPGHELAGTVVRLGEEVEDWHVGDRVAVLQTISCLRCSRCREGTFQLCERMRTYGHERDGGYASHAVVEERSLVSLPAAVPFEWGAVAGCAIGTAYHGLRQVADVQVGDVVVITGATGGTGIHAVQMARMLGAQVVALTRRADTVGLLQDAGADEVVVGPSEGLREAVHARFGRGADVIFDTVGSAVFTGAMRALRTGGRYVLFGQTSRGEISFSPAVAFLRGIDLLSVTGTPLPALERAIYCLAHGLITPRVTVIDGWAQALEAHDRLEAPELVGRLVVSIHSEARPGESDDFE
jgi:acryloyl-coenzyme A reductase